MTNHNTNINAKSDGGSDSPSAALNSMSTITTNIWGCAQIGEVISRGRSEPIPHNHPT